MPTELPREEGDVGPQEGEHERSKGEVGHLLEGHVEFLHAQHAALWVTDNGSSVSGSNKSGSKVSHKLVYTITRVSGRYHVITCI